MTYIPAQNKAGKLFTMAKTIQKKKNANIVASKTKCIKNKSI